MSEEWMQKKFEIQRNVREVLVQYGIDMSQMSFDVFPSRLTLRGVLTRLRAGSEALSPLIIQSMIHDIEKVNGVKRAELELENWRILPTGQILPVDKKKR